MQRLTRLMAGPARLPASGVILSAPAIDLYALMFVNLNIGAGSPALAL